MPKAILIDEYHLTFYAPRGLPETEYDTIRHTLDDLRFHRELRKAIREAIRRHPALGKVRITVTR